MLLGLAIPVSAEADVTFTIESASCDAGDNVRLAIEVESSVKANSFMLKSFTYDEDIFEFVEFDDDDEEDEIAGAALPSMDDEKVIASAGFSSTKGKTLSGTFVHATFKVKSTAPTGDYTISATPVVKLNADVVDAEVIPATISVTGSAAPVGPTPIKVEKDATLDMSEISDSYVDASEGAVVVDERTITGSNIYVTSEGKIRLDDGEHAKISSDNGDGTTNQGFVFGVSNPVGIIEVILEVTGIANEIDYTGKTVTKEFDFTGSEIYGLTNFGFAINNIPKPLEFEVK